MRPIVTPNEMKRLEEEAYAKGSSEEAFMERAGMGVATAARAFLKDFKGHVILLCGKGNNGGDAYVAGRLLLEGGFRVFAFAMEPYTHLAKKKSEEFRKRGGKIHFFHEEKPLSFEGASLIIDGIFGTGFKGSVDGVAAHFIENANRSKVPILSIDIPSGIDGTSGELKSVAIEASKTLFLGCPKIGCFLGDAWNHVGECAIHDFGLETKGAHSAFSLLEEGDIHLAPLKRNVYKYKRGYVVGMAGSFGMPGAAILAGFSALKAGAGIVRVMHPLGMEAEFAGAPYELIREGYLKADLILERMERATALFIGPGIGTSSKTEKVLRKVLEGIKSPVVIDADALTLMAKKGLKVPKDAVLTPHEGEMGRLLGLKERIERRELIERTREYSEKNQTTVVLKGAPTFIFSAGMKAVVSPRGTPLMATAGVGDVLTGMIAAYLARGLNPHDAACYGVYHHGELGEKAANLGGCLVASALCGT